MAVALEHDAAGNAPCRQHAREQSQISGVWSQGVGCNQGCQAWVEEAHNTDQRCELQNVAQHRTALVPGGPQRGTRGIFAALLKASVGFQQPDHARDGQQVAEGIKAQSHGWSCEGNEPATDGGTHQLAHVEDH